jgi:diguanylate cyclase (GGDEF)-like protein
MSAPLNRRPNPSVALLIGLVLTVVAVAAHRFLPERRLSLDPARKGANFYLIKGEDALTQVDWVDHTRTHFRCHFAAGSPGASCGYNYLLAPSVTAMRGTDLSNYTSLKLRIRYTGPANYLRVAIRGYDSRFSRPDDWSSRKFHSLNLEPSDLRQSLAVDLREFIVPEWWVAQYHLPRNLAQPDLGNAVAFAIYLQGEPAGTDHEVVVDRVEFSGAWVSAESWYLGILCVWILLGAGYASTQWIALRRRHREQRQKLSELAEEKDKFEKLSTIDGLTKVLNRHGIEQFVESMQTGQVPVSVIVIDLDHFKRINDQRGHYDGDRVLQTVGELLREHTRSTDGLGRWGGEEFVLVCPGASLSKAANLAEKLRERIMDTNFLPEDPLPVTASFGVASSEASNFDEAFQKADQALYLAKSRGRNCVVAAADDQMHKVTGARKGTWALISGRFKLHGSSARAKES